MNCYIEFSYINALGSEFDLFATRSKVNLASSFEQKLGRAWYADASYQDSRSPVVWFWRRRLLKGFYHIWVWQPCWMTDDNHRYNSDFRLCQESPYKIWLWLAQQFQRRRRLTVTDGQTTEAAYPISSLNGFWEIQPYMNWRGWGMPLWIHSWWPQGHNLNNLSRGLLDKTTNQTSKGWAKKIFTVFPYMGYVKWLTPWAGPLLTPGLLF